MLSFDHPLSERVRSLIRIEHLFNRFNHTVAGEDKWSHHVALATLFEIMECSSRAEMKLDILQELERQRQAGKHQNNQDLWNRIQQTTQDLQDVQQKFGQHIRENEWLMAMKQRMVVAGGTTPVELPSYYYWQHLPTEKRREDLKCWSQSMMPTYQAAHLLLDILRENQHVVECCAEQGNYQQKSLAQNIHLLTVELPTDLGLLPEVSANKYFTHIRFVEANQESMRGKQVEQDVEFKIIMCSFDAELK
ncbi:cell division protein ZapD [Kingella negevensis]|uniref:Cell division protein ZapD n=1 Tax=Kingella negevensis TaxID=1522312 RepID=A0A238TD20_9NEIS|nr:cell division protein ZapD [Kingella negevensis]MDK4680960.1 cell division protein ZapD [Kingella negevensis]MDK4683162.1 cell division protein ZapD [Kingella negevensis]MDK4683955.1 cell division protein ZapD [Kingella negevensis]MDK4691706.1 cell division protein ZapD [Kingella negevensis]MDK4693142.1 cell division protein ZapD [Kingella negevensis]